MSRLKKIGYGAILVGEAVPWRVYDDKGQLLLEEGEIVETDNQLEMLIARGIFLAEDSASETAGQATPGVRSQNPFADLKRWLVDLEWGLDMLNARSPESEATIYDLADRVLILCQDDPDACLAMVHVYALKASPTLQTLFYAIVSALTGRRLGYDDGQLRRLVAAAITANASLMPYQEKLNQSSRKLTDKLREIINKHPILSATLLKQAGIADQRWLEIVEQHHERPDGSGYPAGLKQENLLQEAMLISLAEKYTAMVTVRGYRKRYLAHEALREILLDSRQDRQSLLYRAFCQEVSKSPPGTFVRLANGEIAIVIRRAEAEEPPRVKAVINAGGSPYLVALDRDTRHRDFRVIESVMPDFVPRLNLQALWGYA